MSLCHVDDEIYAPRGTIGIGFAMEEYGDRIMAVGPCVRVQASNETTNQRVVKRVE